MRISKSIKSSITLSTISATPPILIFNITSKFSTTSSHSHQPHKILPYPYRFGGLTPTQCYINKPAQ